jgi:hypothetical protein
MPLAEDNGNGSAPLNERRNQRRYRSEPKPESMPPPSVVREKRREHWTKKDTLLTVIAFGQLCFLPHAVHAVLIQAIAHILRLETPPIGLTLLSYLTGTIIAIVVFIILCYLIRKHHHFPALGLMVVVLAFELLSYPASIWLHKLNQERPQAALTTLEVS